MKRWSILNKIIVLFYLLLTLFIIWRVPHERNSSEKKKLIDAFAKKESIDKNNQESKSFQNELDN